MEKLNFGSLKTVQAQSASKPRLKPWDIYPVTFAGCRVDEHVQGKKDPNQEFNILKIRFENENGYYEESIFFPTEADAKRPVYKTKEGHEREMPSNFERTMTLIAQLAKTITPEGFEKMQAVSAKFENFSDVCQYLIKITDPFKGKFKTNLKLVGRTDKTGTVNASLPRFVALNKSGELFTADNFIGDKVAFTAYEEGERRKYTNAKPTNMDKVATETSSIEDLDSVDTDSLLDEIGNL